MAYYKVVLEGKAYVNQHLCCVANGFGGTGIIKELAKGHFTQRMFFDDILYSVSKDQFATYKPLEPQSTRQNIDEVIKNLEAVGDPPTITIPSNLGAKVHRYGGFEFVSITDVTDLRRYKLQPRMAILRVCGSIYVALNAKVKSQDRPVIVSIAD